MVYGEIEWEKILKHCEEKRDHFTDHDFKPKKKHVGGDFDGYKWKRSSEFYDNPAIFVGGIVNS